MQYLCRTRKNTAEVGQPKKWLRTADFMIGCSLICQTFGNRVLTVKKSDYFGIRDPTDPLGQNRRNRLYTYVRNFNIFHLRPVPSKNIEKCGRSTLRGKQIQIFRISGIPRNCKKFCNIFHELIDNIQTNILVYYLCKLSKK